MPECDMRRLRRSQAGRSCLTRKASPFAPEILLPHRLTAAAELLQIGLLDYIIVGAGSHFSFAEEA